MRKIFCRFLSTILTLIVAFQIFAPKYVRAVTFLKIVSDPTNTTDCLQALKFLNDVPGLNSSPAATGNIEKLCNTECLLKTLSLIFYKIIFSQKKSSIDETFFSKRTFINIESYIRRFLRYGCVGGKPSLPTIIMMLILLDILQNKSNGTLVIEAQNLHKLFATSYLISFKFCEDINYNNKFMACVAGCSVQELNYLELQFLLKTGFRFAPHGEQLDKYYSLFQDLLRKIHNLDKWCI